MLLVLIPLISLEQIDQALGAGELRSMLFGTSKGPIATSASWQQGQGLVVALKELLLSGYQHLEETAELLLTQA
jgi:hypothetical protein